MKMTRGYSLFELLLMVSIVAVILFVAVPRLKFDTLARYKADTIAKKIVTDLRRTRSLAINDAATNTNGYKLEFTGSSPYKTYRIVNQKTSTVIETFSIETPINVTTSGGTNFKFGPLGDLQTDSGTQISVSAQGKTFTITIVSATGTVQCAKS